MGASGAEEGKGNYRYGETGMTFLEAWDAQEPGKQIHNRAVAGAILHVTKGTDPFMDFEQVPGPQRDIGAFFDDHWTKEE